MKQRTLIIVKPDAVKKKVVGSILAVFERENIDIIAMKLVHLSLDEARSFYAVHKERPFYEPLCAFMSSGPAIPAVLEGDNIIERVRTLMGATNPSEAKPGTIRKLFGGNVQNNAIHGSDSQENAKKEIEFFFDVNIL